MNSTRVAELTVDELVELIRSTVRQVLEKQEQKRIDQLSILDIPSLQVGSWPNGVQFLSREEMYSEDGR